LTHLDEETLVVLDHRVETGGDAGVEGVDGGRVGRVEVEFDWV
jgi:hypothetical protein